jgi:hypothetical protein
MNYNLLINIKNANRKKRLRQEIKIDNALLPEIYRSNQYGTG